MLFWLFLAFGVVLVWAILATVSLLYRNPLPFPDRGHRCFAVQNEEAARMVAKIIHRYTGLGERFTFDAGPTHQTLLWDNTTVIIWHDPIVKAIGIPPNAISLVVSDPESVADAVAAELTSCGFVSQAVKGIMPGTDNKLALVESKAFDGCALVFRRHILAMGKPPNKRRLTSK